MRKILFSIGTLILLSMSLSCFAQSGNNQHCTDPNSSLLWKVDGKDSTVYLFGSLHLGLADFYPLAKEIETQFRAADHLVFEVDPRSAMNPEFAVRMQQIGMLGPDEQLSDQLSKPVMEKLKVTLQAMGLPAAQLMRFRPWFLTLLLTSQQMMSMGYQPNYGVEMYLMAEKSTQTKILELESLEEQLSFLAALDGEAYLEYTLNNMEQGKAMMDGMAKAWACADKTALTTLLVDSFDMDGIDNDQLADLKTIFLTDRNRKMATKIEEYIETGKGNYFVVVGAAHYLGDESVIDLLQQRDYDVEAVRLK